MASTESQQQQGQSHLQKQDLATLVSKKFQIPKFFWLGFTFAEADEF